MKIILATLLLSISAFAQSTHIGASANLSASHNLGSKNPTTGAGIDAAKRDDRLVVLGDFAWSNNKKLQTSDGSLLSGSAGARVFASERVFLGGGVEIHYQRTSLYTKASVSPYVEGGYDYRQKVIAAIRYSLPTDENRTTGIGIKADVYQPIAKERKLFLRVGFSFSSFTFTNFYPTERRFVGFRAGASVGIEKRF